MLFKEPTFVLIVIPSIVSIVASGMTLRVSYGDAFVLLFCILDHKVVLEIVFIIVLIVKGFEIPFLVHRETSSNLLRSITLFASTSARIGFSSAFIT